MTILRNACFLVRHNYWQLSHIVIKPKLFGNGHELLIELIFESIRTRLLYNAHLSIAKQILYWSSTLMIWTIPEYTLLYCIMHDWKIQNTHTLLLQFVPSTTCNLFLFFSKIGQNQCGDICEVETKENIIFLYLYHIFEK